MGRQGNVRVDTDLISRLRHLVKTKRKPLGLKKYRSISQAAEEAIEKFLLAEGEGDTAPEAPRQ